MNPVASSALLSSLTGLGLSDELGGRMGLPAARGERWVGEGPAIDSARSRAFCYEEKSFLLALTQRSGTVLRRGILRGSERRMTRRKRPRRAREIRMIFRRLRSGCRTGGRQFPRRHKDHLRTDGEIDSRPHAC